MSSDAKVDQATTPDTTEISQDSQKSKESKKPKRDYQISTSSINRYDQYSIKAQIDDEFVEYLEGKKFVENTNWTDFKILTNGIACVLGYVSHFVMKFPRDWMQVAGCVLVYALIMSVNYLIENYKEKQAFFIVKRHEDPRIKAY